MIDKENAKLQLAAIETFMASAGYSSFRHTMEVEIEGSQTSILNLRPTKLEDLFPLLAEYGRLDALKTQLRFFEEARVTLEAVIDDAVDAERQARDNAINESTQNES